MKKFLSLILVVMFVFSMTTAGFSDVTYNRGPDARINTDVMASTTGYAGGTGPALRTKIVAGNVVLGFTYSDSSAGSLGLYDDSSTTNALAGTLTNLMGEVYVAAGTAQTVMFPLPKKVANGLVMIKTNTTGCAMVYYE